MAKEKSTTVDSDTPERVVTGAVTNVRDLQFPHDPWGFTSMLRKEGARAAGRIKGDPEKLSILIGTLKVLGEFARAKIEVDRAEIERSQEIAARQIETEYARSLAEQEREVARLFAVAESAKAAFAAKKAMPGEVK